MNRALFWTQVVMVWERILPALFPYVLLVALVAVAAQWGLFLNMPSWAHAGVLSVGLLVAIFASIRAVFRFRAPTFTEYNTRLAVDNGVKPERLLAMRHEVDQPPLRVGKAKAGIAESDPYALRFVALVAALLGFLVLGPVPWSRVQHGFMPFAQLDAKADMQLARK
ncbi:hypothetical protein ABAC460_01700 [Asticcacaulis sp. AC460]|nr:hypothetical protein ABAC460_01700 [Asticcacaulis sp. AC460]